MSGIILLGGMVGLVMASYACPLLAASPGDGHVHGISEDRKTDSKAPDEHEHHHGAHEDEVRLTEDALRRSGIRIATAKTRTLTTPVSAAARVAFNAESMARVGSLVNGRVRELKVRVGAVVKKGDVLAVVDSLELGEAQSDFLQKRAAIENLSPLVELAKTAQERAQKIFDENQGISLTEVQSRQREYRAAYGELTSAQAALVAASNRLLLLDMNESDIKALSDSTKIHPTYEIRAPLDGSVIGCDIASGELVGPDKPALFVMADLRTMWVFVDVPEMQSGSISVGLPVDITVTALGAQVVKGKVAYIAPELDPLTRTARVRIQVENEDGRLRAGMFARAEINIKAADGEPIVAVPDDAIQTVEGESVVFVPVAGESNTFTKRQVGIGPVVGGMVPVYAGLSDGEKYVVSGSFVLKAELGKAGAAHEH